MSTTPVQAKPDDMHTVTPHLICRDADAAIDWYVKAFGASGAMRLPGPDGRLMHGQVKIGDSHVMLQNEAPQFGMLGPQSRSGSTVTIHLYVDDADAFVAKAAAAGATVAMPVAEMFWGDRYGVIVDPSGHRWSIATHVRDATPEDMKKAMEEMSTNCGKVDGQDASAGAGDNAGQQARVAS